MVWWVARNNGKGFGRGMADVSYSFPFHMLPDNHVTVGWLSNNMSADHEEVHIPVKKAKPKQPKVVKF